MPLGRCGGSRDEATCLPGSRRLPGPALGNPTQPTRLPVAMFGIGYAHGVNSDLDVCFYPGCERAIVDREACAEHRPMTLRELSEELGVPVEEL